MRQGRLGEIPANLPVVLYLYRHFKAKIKAFQALGGYSPAFPVRIGSGPESVNQVVRSLLCRIDYRTQAIAPLGQMVRLGQMVQPDGRFAGRN
jgi:hypothetical protein